MVGITAYGAYIPIYRLGQAELARAWGGTPRPGEKAVANWDEDSITMAVEAALDCMGNMERGLVDGLFFASTTPPYQEKQNASIVAMAADLKREAVTADFGSSLRSGTIALRSALDAINSGSAKRVLVVSADCRLGAPKSEYEMVFGDGAAALMIGDKDVVAEIEGSYNITSEFIDIWRIEPERSVRTWEDRFILTQGYSEHLKEAVFGLLKKYNLTPKDFAKAVFYAPDARNHATMARTLGFDPKAQVPAPLFATVGNTGSAMAPMMLVSALEEAKAGDRILLAGYGDGADAFIIRVTEGIEKIRDRRGIKRHLESKMEIPNYEKYLLFRDLLEWEPSLRAGEMQTLLSVTWRDRKMVYALYGGRCRKCGTIQLPPQRVCANCQAKDDNEPVRLSDKKAKVFTFSMDERSMVPDLPNVLCIADFEGEGGGRFYSVVTDRDPEKIQIGMPVEMTFRKVHDNFGIHNYYWKCRPIRA
ncbi:hydroxymethylglutaryl-CoA synthase [Chloroflexota bacterium]